MRRQAAAIVQHNGGWYGITFTVREKEIANVNLYSDRNLGELRGIVEGTDYTLALENGSAFLFRLTFPFSDKSKIRLVVGNELEERIPVPVEDMEVNFIQSGKGKVLVSAVPKTLADELRQDRHMRIATVQSLAVLFALRWFDLVPQDDFVFVHLNGNATVIMAYKENCLHLVRQFFRSPGSDSLADAFEDIASDKELNPQRYIMVGDNGEAEHERLRLESRFNIAIDMPSLEQVLGNSDVPDWYWPGIGAALMSLGAKDELNLTGGRNRRSILSARVGLYVSAALACVGILACALTYLDYTMKERTYAYLSAEPARIYKMVFPKSPPIRDPIAIFRQKIKALEKQPGSAGSTINSLVVLNEISKRIPPEIDVRVSEFSSDDKEFTLSGTTVSFGAVEKIKAGLEQINGISQIEAQNLELTGNKQVKFKLRGKL